MKTVQYGNKYEYRNVEIEKQTLKEVLKEFEKKKYQNTDFDSNGEAFCLFNEEFFILWLEAKIKEGKK